MLLNCSVGEDSWESLDCKEIQPVHPKGIHSWVFIGRTDAEAETPILWIPDGKNWLIWNDPDAGKDSRWGEKGTTGGWDGWMASLTRWTWVWIISGRWWWTGRPGVLQSMGLQRVGDDGVTGLNWVCYITSEIDSTDVSFVFHPNSIPLCLLSKHTIIFPSAHFHYGRINVCSLCFQNSVQCGVPSSPLNWNYPYAEAVKSSNSLEMIVPSSISCQQLLAASFQEWGIILSVVFF